MYSYEKEIVEKDENTVQMNVGPSAPDSHGTLPHPSGGGVTHRPLWNHVLVSC